MFLRKSVALMAVSILAYTLISPVDVSANTSPNAKTKASAVQKKPAATKQAKPATAKKATAKSKSRKKTRTNKRAQPAAIQDRFSALVVDAGTGRVLYEKNAGASRYPASLTKMMTLYLTFDALKTGRLRIDQGLPVSAKAAAQPQTNISLDEGDSLPVRKAIESLVVRSANDASMVLAEAIGDTQWNFALLMTRKARQLGMKNTVFRNPNGLPDPQQVTTAYDMARLGIALRRDFPEYYHYFKLRDFTYNGVNYTTHNRVLDRFNGSDGIKTGYIRASGFNLVTSVKRGNYNIVAVVMGGNTANSRDNMMVSILDRTFARLENQNSGIAKRAEVDEMDIEAANDNTPMAIETAMGGR